MRRLSSHRLLLATALSALSALGALASCIATAPSGIHRQTDDDGGTGGSLAFSDAAPPENPELEASAGDPHTVVGAEPSHGPFAGGQRVLIKGKGFSSKARIWFGNVEVDPSTIIPIDPARVQVSAPPGTAGPVDISVQNADDTSTRRTLPGGYTYDALYATPDEGPVPGGTVIEILGQATQWDDTSVVKIDQKPCTTQTVLGPTLINCTVPPGSPGSKTISVKTGADTILVLDAYNYADSDNGYKGGLSGAPLAGHIKVLAFDNYTGDALPGAHVIVGAPLGSALVTQTDATGVAVINDPSLTGPRAVTIASTCHSPITFAATPVDTVTAYLDPVLDPSCASMGDPPPVGGKPSYAGSVKGQLIWPSTVEFKKGLWSNIPPPLGPNERRAAYVFVTTTDPTANFQLPSAGAAVTEDSPGDLGYSFSLYTYPGNRALYALAGIEDRSVSPPKFTAYVMGAVKGVPVLPMAATEDVYIQMVKTLDQTLSMNIVSPAPGPKGPDRLRATVAIGLGNDGFAILPIGKKTPLLPVQGLLSFIGVPPLDGDLAGAVYYATARAQTGPTGAAPLSVIGSLKATSTSQPLQVNGFVNVPTLLTPAINGQWDGTHLSAAFPPGGAPIDLTVYDVQSGNGLVHWLVSVPQGMNAVELPDLSGWPDSAIPPGPLTIGVYGSRHDNFKYSQLRYRDLRPQGMAAYSLDYFNAHL